MKLVPQQKGVCRLSVTVDQEPLAADEMGLRTVGQVLAHLRKDNRLVVQVLIDGEEPEDAKLGSLRLVELAGHAIYIETADPRKLAMEVLDEMTAQLEQAEKFKATAVDLLQKNQTPKALESLGACLRVWQEARDSVTKTAELLRLDLSCIRVGGEALEDVLAEFTEQLRATKSALEQRDYVSLCDVLLYEMADANERWSRTLEALKGVVSGLR